MGIRNHLLTGAALVALASFAPTVSAQDSGSMQVGGTTVSVGGGTAILTLPDVDSFVTINRTAAGAPFIDSIEFSDDFGDEFGWNINGSIETPIGANKTISLNGFWANIDDKDSTVCNDGGPTTSCNWFPLVDDTSAFQFRSTAAGASIVSTTTRDVDQWGLSLEQKWQLSPGISGVTRAPNRRTFALGADMRAIDQEIDVNLRFLNAAATFGPASYSEDLDTRYYGAYAAWGGDYSIPFLSGLTSGLGLQSSFLLRGGVYYADTDYSGRMVDSSTAGNNASSALSLSRDDVAFIGGLVLETKKRIGRRVTLSLKSEYEYYSYAPQMAYNQFDTLAAVQIGTGGQVGTSIGSDDAFSAKTMLRLTIKLGPDSVMESYK